MWNSGYFDTYSTHSVCVGLYLTILSNTPYEPLFEREDFDSIQTISAKNRILIYPNPAQETIYFSFDNFYNESYTIQIVDLKGKIITEFETGLDQIDVLLSGYSSGTYYIRIIDVNKEIRWIEKLLIIH